MYLNKNIKLYNTIIFLFISVFIAQANAAVTINQKTKINVADNADIAQIEALMTSYQDILNHVQVDNIQTVYTENAQFIGQNFPTATGVNNIHSLYSDFLSKLDFNIRFEILEVTLNNKFGFIQTISTGTITPKGTLAGNEEANREIFIVKKENKAWKIYRYIFTAEPK